MNELFLLIRSDDLTLLVFRVLAQVTVITSIAFLLARCCARRTPVIRHGVLLCGLLGCIICPVFTMMMDRFQVQTLTYEVAELAPASPVGIHEAEQHDFQPVAESTNSIVLSETMMLSESNIGPAAQPKNASPATSWGGGILKSAFAIYLLGVCLLIGRLLKGLWLVHRLRRDAAACSDLETERILESVTREIGIKHAPAIRQCNNIGSPLTTGTIRPVILISGGLSDSLDKQQLRHVLLHECAHVKRRDCLTGILQRLVAILYWPHPLIHLVNRDLADAREEICDNYVLGNESPAAYGSTLLNLAEKLPAQRAAVPAVGLFARQENLQRRIEKLLDSRRPLMTQLRPSSFGLMAISFLSVIVLVAGTHITTAQEAAGKDGNARASQAASFDDSKLNEKQKLYRDWTNRNFANLLDESQYKKWTDALRTKAETRWLTEIVDSKGRERIPAINGLAGIRSAKAVNALSPIAFERIEKDNRDRWMAVRALGLLGDDSVVPDLVHLTYHYNLNTRLWAQISLVRLTGENFGSDVDAWRTWWDKAGKQPAISTETIVWTKRKEWSDPKAMAESEAQWMAAVKKGGAGNAPRIVSSSPKVGATEVDPSIKEITVTFDRDMRGGFSWTGGGEQFPPSPVGAKATWRDKRTCVLPVKLQAGRFYRVGINSKSFQNFRSVEGVPAPVSAIFFTTKGASDDVKHQTKQPTIVKMNPANGANDVDPDLTELTVMFDVPMAKGFSWTGGGAKFPEIPEGQRPKWSKDGKTCTLPVKLKPSWECRLGLNSVSFKNFQSAGGVPLKPVVYTFKTRAE